MVMLQSVCQEIRQLMAFAYEQHGNAFRRVALAALLEGRARPAEATSNSSIDM